MYSIVVFAYKEVGSGSGCGMCGSLGMQENASQLAFLDGKDSCVCFAGFCLGYEGTVIMFYHYTKQ